MRAAARVAAVGAALLVPASLAQGAGTPRPRVALSASPARVAVVGPAARRIELRNLGSATVDVDATRIKLGRRPARSWITVVPRRIALRAGATASLTVRIVPPRRATPGDHHALVLLTSRSVRRPGVAVRMRLGLLVRVRVPGRIVRRLELLGLRARRDRGVRVISLSLANLGNVTEELHPGRIVVSLVRRGRAVARLRPSGRDLLPGDRRLVEAPYAGSLRGRLTAVVAVRGATTHRYRIRLW